MKRGLISLMICILCLLSFYACGKAEKPQSREEAYIFTASTSWDLSQGRIDFADQPNDPVFQYVKAKAGVVPQCYAFNWEGGVGYMDSVRRLLAEGIIPEAILSPFQTTFVKELYDLGILIPLDDYLDNAPLVKAMFTEEDWDVVRSLTPDGKIYYIPGKSIEPRQGMIRKDWLDAVGMDVPTTKDELVKVYKAFRDQDANGNGDPNDEIPVSGREGMRWCDDLYVMHGVAMYEGHPQWSWDERQQKLISHQVSKEMKEAVTFIRYLIEEGLMEKTMPIQGGTDWFAKIAGDKIGHIFHLQSALHYHLVSATDGTNPDAEFVYMPNVTVPGVPHQKNFYPGIGVPLLCITTKAKDPGKIMEWVNWNLTEEGKNLNFYGIAGVNYNVVNGKSVSIAGAPHQVFQYSLGIANMDAEVYSQTPFGDMKVAIYKASINDGRGLDNIGMPSSIFDGYEDILDNSMGNVYRQYTAKFILGELPMSDWDKYVAEWRKRGGNIVEERATAWYKSVHHIK